MKIFNQLLKGKGMITAAIWYTAANFFINSISLFSTPIFTRLLTPADYGIVAIYTMWVSIFSLFVGLQVSGSFNNALIDFGEEKFDGYISSVSSISILSFIFILAIFSSIPDYVSKFLGLSKSLIYLMVIHSFATNCILQMTSKFQCRQQRYLFIMMSALIAFTTIPLSIILVFNMPIETRYLGRIYGTAFPTIVIGVGCLLYSLLKGRKIISRSNWFYCLPISIPLILHGLSGLLLAQSDRYMLSKILSEYEVGIYSFAYTMGSIVSTITMAFNNAWVPWYYQQVRHRKIQNIDRTYKLYRAIIMMLTVGYLLISPEFIKLMGSEEFQQGIDITPIIVLGFFYAFLYLLPVNYEFYHKKTTWISIGTVFAAILNILLNLLLIPLYKGLGAAIATMISYGALFVAHDLLVKSKLRDFSINRKDLYLSAGAMTVITITVYFLNDYWYLRYPLLLVFCVIFVQYMLKELRY